MTEGSFIERCIIGDVNSENWRAWISENHDESVSDFEKMGLLEEEYDDLKKGLRSIDFYILKKKSRRFIHSLWAGCYVKFLFETDLHNPHFEYGWVDVVGSRQDFCKIQCDDSFFGMRAVTVRIIDVMEIMPMKERPLVYYKTMMCGECNLCDRSSNEVPFGKCPFYDFFNAVLSKQKGDQKFINMYNGIYEKINDGNDSCCGLSCEGCKNIENCRK